MLNTAATVDRVLRTAGIPIDGVSIGDPAIRATWTVAFTAAATPTQKTQAQGIIDAFNPADPAHETADQDAAVKAALDTERLISAVVWTILDTYSPPATIAKYQTARTKVIAAYKAKPWV